MVGLLHAFYSWQVAPIIHWMGECSRTDLEILKEKSPPNHELNHNSWLQFLNSSVSVNISIVSTVPNCIMICRFCTRLEVARWKL